MHQNHHLNLFRFFNESDQKQFIENNLSRAFAICLQNNSLLFSEFIKTLVDVSEYESLFNIIDKDTQCLIDIQVDPSSSIELESYTKVYAIALTSETIDMGDFLTQPKYDDKRNRTDIFIGIKDIAFVIEVKKHGENCKAQLYNQIVPFINNERDPSKQTEIIAKSVSWQQITRLMENTRNVQRLTQQHSPFLSDFLGLSERQFPHWFNPKPFNSIALVKENISQLQKRMRQALADVGQSYQLLPFSDRFGISVPFGWAGEILLDFANYPFGSYIVFYIYAANTKQQGYPIFNGNLDWVNRSSLRINNIDYKLETNYEIKLCHFNKYISGIQFRKDDTVKEIHTKDNFYHQSGKWHRNAWKDLEKFLDDHFKPEFNWREKCKWNDYFINTERNYLTMSIGYSSALFIPYSDFTIIDKNDADVGKVTDFLKSIIEGLKNMTRSIA